jgi:molybdate transport system permease protein
MELDLSPLWISLKTSTIATAITFLIGIAAARWMLDCRSRFRGLIDGCLISPLVLPPTVVGFVLLILLGKSSPIGHFLNQLGITITFTWYAAILTATVVAFPIMYRTSLSAFEQIDPNLLRVARTLGASEWIVFWQVMLPLAYRGIVASTILSFARALGEFGATLMLAGNIPGQTQTMPVAIFFAAEAGDFTQALVWVLIILTISLAVIWIANSWAEDRLVVPSQSSPTQPTDPWKQTPSLAPIAQEVELVVDIQKQLASFPLDVSLASHQDALGILGASGSGKSMLLRCIAGLETPDRGYIRLNGRTLFHSSEGINVPSRDRRIGIVFQSYALFPHLTVAQNIAFGVKFASRASRHSKQAHDRQIMLQITQLHLQGLEHRYPSQLSGGQQQRVALARALASQPEALLLDEPFSALDTYLRSQLEQQMIARLANYQGATLFVTHNLEEAYRICPNLMILESGRAIAHSSKQGIFEHPSTFRVAQLTGCKNFSRAVAITSQCIDATDWGIRLQMLEPLIERLSAPIAYVGIRAHQIIFTSETTQSNTFPCWLVATSETPHRMTVFLKFNSVPTHPQDYHLQAEVFKEKWMAIKDRPLPWHIRLDPLRLIAMPA